MLYFCVHIKVFLHTPHHRAKPLELLPGVGSQPRHESKLSSVSSVESDTMLLSFGQHITALTAGKLDPSLNRDILLIGSQTNVLAYDVEKNSDLYYKDVRCYVMKSRMKMATSYISPWSN